MYQTVYTGDAAEASAAIFPCPWLYQEIGQKLKYASSNRPLYAEWIALCDSDEMEKTIEQQKR